jgi:hypothetical protein
LSGHFAWHYSSISTVDLHVVDHSTQTGGHSGGMISLRQYLKPPVGAVAVVWLGVWISGRDGFTSVREQVPF